MLTDSQTDAWLDIQTPPTISWSHLEEMVGKYFQIVDFVTLWRRYGCPVPLFLAMGQKRSRCGGINDVIRFPTLWLWSVQEDECIGMAYCEIIHQRQKEEESVSRRAQWQARQFLDEGSYQVHWQISATDSLNFTGIHLSESLPLGRKCARAEIENEHIFFTKRTMYCWLF